MEVNLPEEHNRLLHQFTVLKPRATNTEYLWPKFIIHDQEPILYHNQKTNWEFFYHQFTRLDKRIMMLVSEKNSTELDSICQDLGIIPIYWFSNGALALDWYGSHRFHLDSDDIRRSKNLERLRYKFSCVNRLIGQDRIYRPILSKFMHDNIDHDHLILSCSVVDPVDNIKAVDRAEILLPQHHRDLLLTLSDNESPILVNIPGSDLSDGGIRNTSFDPDTHLFDQTFCHVVTETLFYSRSLHLTEKSLRPLVNKRPFIIAGPCGSLEYLRSYGFKTFADFWDESYDSIADPNERLDKIMSLIEVLNKKSLKEMEAILDGMNEIIEHNFNHFYSDFGSLIRNELYSNLYKAIDTYKSQTDKNGWLLGRIMSLTQEELQHLIKNKDKAVKQQEEVQHPHAQRKLTTDALKNNDWKFIDEIRISYLLGEEIGFKPTVSKEEILAHFSHWLS